MKDGQYSKADELVKKGIGHCQGCQWRDGQFSCWFHNTKNELTCEIISNWEKDQKWFQMVEEDEKEEKVLYSCNVIVVEVNFQERRVLKGQDDWTINRIIIVSYIQIEERVAVILMSKALIGKMRRSTWWS